MTTPTTPISQGNFRQQAILDELRRSGGAARIHALAAALGVTEETVRRNIKRLSEMGLVERMHGGARLLASEEGDLNQRMAENPGAKRRIARAVARLIPDGASLFLDIGSTTNYIAEALRRHQALMVVTNSVTVAYRLAARNGNRVFMAGGELRPHDGGAFGAEAMDFARRFRTDYAVLSAAAITAADGLMLHDIEEASFSRLIMQNAACRIVAADGRKFHRRAPIVAADLSMVDILVSDEPPPGELEEAAREHDIRLILAD